MLRRSQTFRQTGFWKNSDASTGPRLRRVRELLTMSHLGFGKGHLGFGKAHLGAGKAHLGAGKAHLGFEKAHKNNFFGHLKKNKFSASFANFKTYAALNSHIVLHIKTS